jgi:mannose-1-phosphate guanylyltransferase
MAKGTGPAIALAAAVIAKSDPDAIMGSFAADHDVKNPVVLHQAVTAAIEAAESGWFVTIGVVPTTADVGYGYIERSDEIIALVNEVQVSRARRFEEKPDLPTATQFLESGNHLWYSSYFIVKVSIFLEELSRAQPALYGSVMRIADSWGTPKQEATMVAEWIDLKYGTLEEQLIEQMSTIAVVAADMGWSDVGEWQRLARLIEGDSHGNSIHTKNSSNIVNIGSHGNVVWSETDRIIALIHLEDMVVVDTQDALLVADKSMIQEVRTVARHLEEDRSVGPLDQKE